MSTLSYGAEHARLLDQGINLAAILPDNCLSGMESSYFGAGNGGMLVLEQSPHVENAHATRLQILGSIAGMGSYRDENKAVFMLSNNVSLPDGTHVLLRETLERSIAEVPEQLPENAIALFEDISGFVRSMAGNIQSVEICNVRCENELQTNISGVYTSDEMRAAYIQSVQNGIVEEIENPVSGRSAASTVHTIFTPGLSQMVTVKMFDHRPGSREAMLRQQT